MLRALIAFARFELELFFTAFIAVFFTYVAPSAIFISIMAAGKGDPAHVAAEAFPLIIGLIIVFVSFYTLASQVVTYREAGFYKRILVTRINPVGIALSNAIRGYAVILIGCVILLAESLIIFRVIPDINFFEAGLAIIISGAGLFLMALVPACFVKRPASMFTLSSFLSYVFMFTAGVRPDLGRFSATVDTVDRFSPSFYAFRILGAGFRGTLFTLPVLWAVLVILGCIAASLYIIRRNLSWM